MSDLRFGRSETNIRMVRTFELFSAQIITYYMCMYIYVCTLIECSLERILVVWYPTPSLSFSERLPILTTGTRLGYLIHNQELLSMSLFPLM